VWWLRQECSYPKTKTWRVSMYEDGCAHAQLEVAYQIQIMTRNSTNSATNSSWNFLDAHHIFRDTCALARANCCDLKLWEQQYQDLGCFSRKHNATART